MTRLINNPIKITTDSVGKITGFTWQNQWFKIVALIERWVESGEWWDGEAELQIYRVVTCPNGLYEIHFHSPKGSEVPSPIDGLLYRVFD